MTTSGATGMMSIDDDTASNSANNNPKLSYRKARLEDLPGIADLLERSFPDDDNDNDDTQEEEEEEEEKTTTTTTTWSWKNPFAQDTNYLPKMDDTQKLIQLLEQRLTLPQHVLIVVIDPSNSYDQVVGFMELGTMPAPVPISVPIHIPSGTIITTPTTSEKQVVSVRPERPFLANLAVDPSWRRQQIGSKLVQLALKVGTQWESVKANSTSSGTGGYSFYFHPSSNDDDDGNNDNDDANDTTRKLLLSTLYLSVDCDNADAIAFYERLQFTTVLNEQDANTPSSTRTSRRKPKLYLEKELILYQQ